MYNHNSMIYFTKGSLIEHQSMIDENNMVENDIRARSSHESKTYVH